MNTKTHTPKPDPAANQDTEAASDGAPCSPSDYDAGLLNDYGGGDVEWWQDYLRAEIGRANDAWREVHENTNMELMLSEIANARMKSGLLELRKRIRNSQNQTASLMKMAMIVENSLENAPPTRATD